MFVARLRKWGNSLGFTISKDIVKEMKLKEDQDIIILNIQPKDKLKKSI